MIPIPKDSPGPLPREPEERRGLRQVLCGSKPGVRPGGPGTLGPGEWAKEEGQAGG
jgi:hypothetical protein